MAGKTCGYDPYENVVKVMEKAMDIGHINKDMFEIIKNPQLPKAASRWIPKRFPNVSLKH